jgi:hypothetical protein
VTPGLGFIHAVAEFLRERADWVVILLGMLAILSFIEVRLTALFLRHEKREEQMHAASALMGETASAIAKDAHRKIEELRASTATVQDRAVDLASQVRMHDKRLGAVEERLMRAALLVPSPRRPGGSD